MIPIAKKVKQSTTIEKNPMELILLNKRIGNKIVNIINEYSIGCPQSLALNVLQTNWSVWVPKNITYAIKKQALVQIKRVDI